uniref:Uncharacterized protein n=1 Tax=Anguilla anguilla TaxID=7936 RepID=A0A0E9RCT4_ANGAN
MRCVLWKMALNRWVRGIELLGEKLICLSCLKLCSTTSIYI